MFGGQPPGSAIEGSALSLCPCGVVGMSDNGLPLPVSKFATVDLGATAPIRVGLSTQTGLKNVLDRSYDYRDGFPEAGRNRYRNLRYQF